MDLALLLAAVLGGSITPMSMSSSFGADRIVAFAVGEYALVAYLPECVSSHETRERTLRDAADRIAASSDREVVLTDDLRTYLSLKRMEKKGASEYERRVLASRLSRLGEALYTSSPPATTLSD